MQKTKSQRESFKKTARELGADESDDALDKSMGRLNLKRRQEKEQETPGAKPDDS